MSNQCLSVVLAERPTETIVPGRTFRVESRPAPTVADLRDGQLLVETLYLSLDPAMRSWLSEKGSYMGVIPLGGTMLSGGVVGRVLASRSAKARTGALVVAYPGWTEVAVVDERQVETGALASALAGAPPGVLRPTDLLGVLGPTGRTAYIGLKRIAGGIRPTDTVVVSGAAGATGSVAGQLARLQGAKRVVGIAGSADKVRWLVDELGFDAALNYKDPGFAQQFKAATPDRIDVYWDNVGGDILDLALARANTFARFVICGGISQYNTSNVQGPRNFLNVITQRIKMQGFLLFDYKDDYDEATRELAKYLAEGKLKRRETIVKGGLRVAEQALHDLYEGRNTGKLLVEVKDPGEAASKL